jgi:superfamily II DNA or RNA helicase
MISKVKYTVRKATISDKIYFHSSDLVDIDLHTLRYVLFTYNLVDSFFSTIEYNEDTGMCSVPSGAWHKLNILELVDNRFVSEEQDWTFNGSLRPNQQDAVNTLLTENKLYSGLIQAACGWGKTMASTYIIGTYKKPTLVVCHTKLLAEQWHKELKTLISGTEIGFIGDGRDSIKPITVGIYKSLIKRLDKLQDQFEVMFVDEAHLCPADTFSKVVNGINAKVKIALTATPWRKDGLHVILPDYFGPNKVIAKDISKLVPSVEVVKTTVPFTIINPNRDWTKQLSKLGTNTAYIDLISAHARDKISGGRCLLIISERIEMLEQLKSRIPNSILLVGATKNRDDILNNVGTKYSAILTTKIFDEGISCHRLDTIYFTCPNNNAAKLEQRIGRIQRDHPHKKSPLIVDFWLAGAIVQAQQRNRLEWYTRNNFPILKD